MACMQVMYTIAFLFPGNKEECISTLQALKCMVSLRPLMRVCRSSGALQKILDFSPTFLQGPKGQEEFAVCVF